MRETVPNDAIRLCAIDGRLPWTCWTAEADPPRHRSLVCVRLESEMKIEVLIMIFILKKSLAFLEH